MVPPAAGAQYQDEPEPIDRRLFVTLLGAGVVSLLLGIPYLVASGVLTNLPPGFTPLSAALVSVLENAILVAVAIYVGLRLGPRVGLTTPFLTAWLGDRKRPWRYDTLFAVLSGIGVAILIAVLALVLNPLVPAALTTGAAVPPAWAAFLASFQGGVFEEELARLGVMTLVVWIAWRVGGGPAAGRRATRGEMWAGILVAALLFGLGHLPATSTLVPLTGFVVLRAVLLNGVGGVVFGWIFWKNGFEMAVVAHLTTDLLIHFLPALLP